MSIEPFYRFRKVNSLFGEHKELERQSIYFASPEELNDPLEGFRDIYWEGDEVVWENLFRNYLLSLTFSTFDYMLVGEDHSIEKNVTTLVSLEDQTKEFNVEFNAIADAFFGNEQVRAFISNIANHRTKLGESELTLYLKSIHLLALFYIFERLVEKGFSSHNIIVDQCLQSLNNMNESWFKSVNETANERGPDVLHRLLEIQGQISTQHQLMLDYNNDEKKPNKKLLVINFYQVYVKKLEDLMYPDWYTACFMTECSNSSVWGNYGDNHKGVCMIFSPQSEQDRLSLPFSNAITGWNQKGATKGKISLTFESINYKEKPKPVNFFESIGRVMLGRVFSEWFISRDGVKSTLTPSYSDEWREQYWGSFHDAISLKSKDWEYEKEHRLILTNMTGSYNNHDKTLKYEFTSLKGIIFGIKTSEDDKHRIIKLIETKVRENKHYDFKFYQAYYCRETAEIKHFELRLLDFKKLAESS